MKGTDTEIFGTALDMCLLLQQLCHAFLGLSYIVNLLMHVDLITLIYPVQTWDRPIITIGMSIDLDNP